jgi:hypothetical protein
MNNIKRFDVVVGNPPYQAKKERKSDKHSIKAGAAILWNKFVEMSIDKLTKPNGYICLIHPAGWRRPNPTSEELGIQMKSKNILYLELHPIKDGKAVFGKDTNYDWYIMQNSPNNTPTTIKDYEGKINIVSLKDLTFIPNSQIDKVSKIMAKSGEETCEIIHSYSSYFTLKPYMNDKLCGEFIYPCVYSLPQKGYSFYYSSTKQHGHFGIPKVIVSNGAASQVLIDENGDYGITQFAFGISDKKENLPKIKKALESKKFIELCGHFRFTYDRYDLGYFKRFKKDFWKEFIN